MTFRNETETLRARVDELERENERLVQEKSAQLANANKPRFDKTRLFRRIAWWFLSSENITVYEYPGYTLTRWGVAVVTWSLLCVVTTLVMGAQFIGHGNAVQLITACVSLAVFGVIAILRTWFRYAMRLDDSGEQQRWAKRFE